MEGKKKIFYSRLIMEKEPRNKQHIFISPLRHKKIIYVYICITHTVMRKKVSLTGIDLSLPMH